MMSLGDLGGSGTTLIVTALIGVLGFLVRKGWKLNVLATRAFVDIVGTPEQPSLRKEFEGLKTTVDTLRREVHPNSGKSLGEAVNEIREMSTAAKEKATAAALAADVHAEALFRFQQESKHRAEAATRERTGVQETLDVLTRSLMDFAGESHRRKVAYVTALQEIGIDLTHVTDEMEIPPHTHQVETATSQPEREGDDV